MLAVGGRPDALIALVQECTLASVALTPAQYSTMTVPDVYGELPHQAEPEIGPAGAGAGVGA